MSKYGNQTTVVNGRTFDSRAEARRYVVLLGMERLGVITDLRCQVPFVLAPAVHLRGAARKSPALRYFADFVYLCNGNVTIEDVKGKSTDVYKLKRHLMAVAGHHITEIRA